MNKLKSLSALYLVLIITIETISAVQFLPFLINRRSPNRLDHHKLLKEINELDYSHDLATKQPTNDNTLTVESAPAQLVSSVAKKHPVSRKRDFNLDDFTLADLLSLNDEQAPPIGRGESGIMAPTLASSPAVNVGRSLSTTGSSPATQSPRSMNACDKTRVAAGTSGYMRLSCMDGLSTTTRGPSASALTDMRASLLHQLDNAQFRRMNSNFEQLVDALRSGAGTSWPST